MSDNLQNVEDSKEMPAAVTAIFEMAKKGLAKLPILGPALWLYARDPVRRFLFVSDIDWAILPPVVLDQCRLYLKDSLPCAFFSWAFVDGAVADRLRTGQSKLAPHEWNVGEDVWVIDAVAPFGQLDEMLLELRQTVLAGRKVSTLLPDPENIGALIVREFSPEEARSGGAQSEGGAASN
ncbi:toxin-activating lysine-acyltransferase [uncultured Propionivibrio sp.]|uniref:toxin-activating lysine-acyltransferase n=1 Tax=uncultured Propionivibrio sp. TaxID=426737 RepID=UPI0029C0A1F8|nr:toxin-activating lysine-acyltransferase [uncultured Propionivibrio sp.]